MYNFCTTNPYVAPFIAILITYGKLYYYCNYGYYVSFQCCFTSTEIIRLIIIIMDGEPRTVTSTFTQLLSSELLRSSYLNFVQHIELYFYVRGSRFINIISGSRGSIAHND